MAIFRPSNFYPNLEEIDFREQNIFYCQVNTSGTTVKAYKIELLSEQGETIWAPDILSYNSTNLFFTSFLRNKGILKLQEFYTISVETMPATLLKNRLYYLSKVDGTLAIGFYVNTGASGVDNITYLPDLQNGKNYIWNLRLYEAVPNSENQPLTKVCTGYITGSTKSVVWTTDNELIEKDQWLEVKTTGPSQMFDPLPPNTDNLILPAAGEEYAQREQITWITDELGNFKDITKIELEEELKYNYKEGTEFNIYQVSDEHTTTTVFADPNDDVDIGAQWITIYNGQTDDSGCYPYNVFPMDYANKSAVYSLIAPTDVNYTKGEEIYCFVINSSAANGIDIYQVNSTDTNSWDNITGDVVFAPSINYVTSLNISDAVDGEYYRITQVSYPYSSVVPGSNYNSLQTYYIYADEDYSAVSSVVAQNYFTNLGPNQLYTRSDPEDAYQPGIYVYNSTNNWVAQDCLVFDKNYKALFEETDNDSSVDGSIGAYLAEPRKRKVIGYTVENGEFRVSEAFCDIPKNGYTYLLYETQYDTYESLTDEKKLVVFSASNIIGGAPLTSGKIITNCLNSSEVFYKHDTVDTTPKQYAYTHVFIQPNIGIVSDETNPQEIVLTTGERINVSQLIGTPLTGGEEDVDLTIDRLDDSQWMITNPTSVSGVTLDTDILIPKKKYTAYSDFINSSPQNIIYSKNKPTITLRFNWAYKEQTDDMDTTWPRILYKTSELEELPASAIERDYYTLDSVINKQYVQWREIMFYGEWQSDNNVQIKNYYYELYKNTGDSLDDLDFTKLTTSDVYYSNTNTWSFHGFDKGIKSIGVSGGYVANAYKVKIYIEDEFGVVHTKENIFFIKYDTVNSFVTVTQTFDCDDKSMKIDVDLPKNVMTYDITEENAEYYSDFLSIEPEGSTRTTVSDINLDSTDGYIEIPEDYILNYTYLLDEEAESESELDPITLPSNLAFYSQFKFSYDFIQRFKDEEEGNNRMVEQAIWSIRIKNDNEEHIYTLKATSFSALFSAPTSTGRILTKNNSFARLYLYRDGVKMAGNIFTGLDGEYVSEHPDRVELKDDLSEAGYSLHYPDVFMYAIQPSNRVSSAGSLPTANVLQYIYVGSVEDGVVYRNTNYGQTGEAVWEVDESTIFLMIDNTAEYTDTDAKVFNYDELNVPSNMRDGYPGTLSTTGPINWQELSPSDITQQYFYLETDISRYNQDNYDAIEGVWFKTLFKVDPSYTEVEDLPDVGDPAKQLYVTLETDVYSMANFFAADGSTIIKVVKGEFPETPVAGTYYWGPDGDYFKVKYLNDDSEFVEFDVPEDVNFYYAQITESGVTTNTYFHYITGTQTIPTIYDGVVNKFYTQNPTVSCQITASSII